MFKKLQRKPLNNQHSSCRFAKTTLTIALMEIDSNRNNSHYKRYYRENMKLQYYTGPQKLKDCHCLVVFFGLTFSVKWNFGKIILNNLFPFFPGPMIGRWYWWERKTLEASLWKYVLYNIWFLWWHALSSWKRESGELYISKLKFLTLQSLQVYSCRWHHGLVHFLVPTDPMSQGRLGFVHILLPPQSHLPRWLWCWTIVQI